MTIHLLACIFGTLSGDTVTNKLTENWFVQELAIPSELSVGTRHLVWTAKQPMDTWIDGCRHCHSFICRQKQNSELHFAVSSVLLVSFKSFKSPLKPSHRSIERLYYTVLLKASILPNMSLLFESHGQFREFLEGSICVLYWKCEASTI